MSKEREEYRKTDTTKKNWDKMIAPLRPNKPLFMEYFGYDADRKKEALLKKMNDHS